MLKFGVLFFVAFCVVRAQDDHGCQIDEVFSDCAQPRDCVTCKFPERCPTFACTKGCDCKPGYLRDANRMCIQPSQCPNRPCNDDETYYGCTPSCKNNCENYGNPGIRCGCELPSCFCKEGLVQRRDGKCVKFEDCEQKNHGCKVNEVFSDCAQPTVCVTCEHPEKCPTFACTSGCDCKPGYLRNTNGICILASQCQNRTVPCKDDEKYYDCTPSCKNNCRTFGNPGIRCGCGPPGCFCKEGLVKRKDGKCVKFEDCAPRTGYGGCPANEEIVPCSKPKWCNTCLIRGNCKLASCPEGCDCKRNFFRDENSVCIPSDQCPEPKPS